MCEEQRAEPAQPPGTFHRPQARSGVGSLNRVSERPVDGVLKAVVAGAVAVWVMDRFDWFAFNHEDKQARQRTESVRPGPGLDPAHAVAAKLAHALGGRLSAEPAHRHPAGLAVHYAIPIGLTYIYRMLGRRIPAVQMGRGSLFGAGCFLALDQVVNPALGVAANPRRYPWQRNARELLSHCIFGLVAHSMLNRLQLRRARYVPNQPNPYAVPPARRC